MSTFVLRRFSHPESLKAIAPERLLKFLAPYRAYLEARGLSLPDDGADLDYTALVLILVNPDEDVPTEMVDALYIVHETADDEVSEVLLAEATAREIELNLTDEATAADVAIAVWLAAPDLLRQVHAESFVARPRRFEYYSGSFAAARAFPAYSPKLLKEICAVLDDWFAKNKRGEGSEIFIVPRGEKIYVLIRHGTTMRREGSITRGKRGVEYYRPEVHDVLVYDTRLDILGLKAGTQGEKALYRSTLGLLLFGEGGYFANRFEMSLAPVRERGPGVLECADVDGLDCVRLVEVRRWFGGEFRERDIKQASDLFRALGDGWQSVLRSGKLTGATFELTIGFGKEARMRKVSISLPDVAKYDRDDEDADVIERWLRRRNIMPEPPQEEADGKLPESLVARIGNGTEADNRQAGVATAAG